MIVTWSAVRKQLNLAQFSEASEGGNYFFGRRGVGGDASCHRSAGRRPRDRRIKRQYNIVNHGWQRTTGGQQCGGVFRQCSSISRLEMQNPGEAIRDGGVERL